MTITWNGRAYVDEDKLTQEQYDTFFEHGEYNIKLDIANLILSEKDGDEVVPCDELNPEVRCQIASQMHYNHECGTATELTADGRYIKLNWAWNPAFTDDDGEEVGVDSLPYDVLDKIIYDMLESESRWGMVDY